jgi:putative transcriptional regulator
MNKLKELRLKAKMTQKELAEELKVTPDYISMIERGDRTPGFRLSKKMADYFNTTVDEIFFAQDKNETFAGSLYQNLKRMFRGK